MAATLHGFLRVKPVDGLCTTCWFPRLVHVALIILLPTGVTERDRGIRCAHCRDTA